MTAAPDKEAILRKHMAGRAVALHEMSTADRVEHIVLETIYAARWGMGDDNARQLIRELSGFGIDDDAWWRLIDEVYDLTDTVSSLSSDGDEPILPCLIERLAPRQGVGLLGGASGAGKTFVLLSLAYCVATGRPFFGRAVNRNESGATGGVVFIAAEASRTILPRWRALCEHNNSGGDHYALPFSVVHYRDAASVPLQVALARAQWPSEHVALIIVDTLPAAFPEVDESSAGPATATMQTLAAWSRREDCLVMASRHTGKNGEDRGSTAWATSADVVLKIPPPIDGTRRLDMTKNRDGEPTTVGSFTIKSIDLDGRSVGVAVEAGGEARRNPPEAKARSSGADLLAACFAELVLFGEGEGLGGATAVPKASVFQAFKAKWSGSMDPSNLGKAFAKAVAGAGLGSGNHNGVAFITQPKASV
jgi:hypothetical protein